MAVDALAAQLDAAKLSASEEEEDSVVLIDDVAECKTRLTRLLETKEPVAVDFEGVDLCRAGKLCVVQLAPRAGSVLLVDVEVLGEAAFGAGRLRELLESPMVLKIGYDGRADSDALWHLHGTRLKNVWDVQVRCPWCSSCKPPQNPSSLLQSRARPRPTWATSMRPPAALSYVALLLLCYATGRLQVAYCTKRDSTLGRGRDRFVKGLGMALQDLPSITLAERRRMEALKAAGKKLFAPELGGSYDVWRARPMPAALVAYCALDVKYLHAMRDAWASYVPDHSMRSIVEKRIAKAIGASAPAKGRQMAIKDWQKDW